MKRALVAVVAIMMIGAPAWGQEQPAASTWTLETAVGVGGFIDPTAPLVVDVTLSSEVLLVGRLDLAAAGVTTSVAVEIPAGGVKTFRLDGPAVQDRRLVTVRLFDTTGDEPRELEAQQLRVTVPLRQIIVGLVDGAEAEAELRGATPEPAEFDLELIRLEPDDLPRAFGVLDYVVVGAGGFGDMPAEIADGLRRWVDEGGSVIGAVGDVSTVADPGGGTIWPGTAVSIRRVGKGSVMAVASLASVTADEWSSVLRATSNTGLTRVNIDGRGPGLVSAAAAGREASVPGLSWLLLGIIVFVLLVGPINFLVLRGLAKPELAWFTVPALSVVFVIGFWIAGRSQVADAAVTTSSVVIGEGDQTVASTGAVLQVSSGGERVLRFPDGWQTVSGGAGGFANGVVDPDDASAISFELDDLGVGAVEARSVGVGGSGVGVSIGDDGVTDVTNGGSYSFWSWGLVIDGVGYTVSTSTGAVLEPGGAAQLTVQSRRPVNRFEPVILETAQRVGIRDPNFFETTYTVLSALAYEAEGLDRDLTRNGSYFFGFTDDVDPGLSVDGRVVPAPGTTLFVQAVDVPAAFGAGKPVQPTLLDVEGAATVEQYGDEVYAFGADAVWFRYFLPETAETRAKIGPVGGQLQVAQIYDWAEGSFIPYTWGAVIDLTRFTSPAGELIVRAAPSENQQFFEETLLLSRFQLNWGSA